jgi:hypothetical protein
MSKNRTLGNFVSTGSAFADGTIVVASFSDLTASAAELDKLDGVTASTAEINYLDGVSSNIQSQFNGLVKVSVDGPAPGVIYSGVAQTFTITDYDSFTTYTLSTTNGTVTRSGATITYTPSTAGPGGFVINGRNISGYTVGVLAVGQQAYTTPGTYSWVAPADVPSVSVVAVGAGGAGITMNYAGGGGGLGWKNNIAVVSGNSYTVVVGAAAQDYNGTPGGDSYFISTATVKGGGGLHRYGGTYTGDGGGNGGSSVNFGSGGGTSGYGGAGGGAGGYSGKGGDGYFNTTGQNGAGGGGGGGGFASGQTNYPGIGSVGGGGVGLLGQGANGLGGFYSYANSTATNSATGGSGGGRAGADNVAGGNATTSGLYGGGGCYLSYPAPGAVRIIWPGLTRSFPSTNTGDM